MKTIARIQMTKVRPINQSPIQGLECLKKIIVNDHFLVKFFHYFLNSFYLKSLITNYW